MRMVFYLCVGGLAPLSSAVPPLYPSPPAQPGWAAPWTVHLLGLAVAGSIALWLSLSWWGRLARELQDRPPHPGYSLALTLGAFAAAYGLECLYYLILPSYPELVEAWPAASSFFWVLSFIRLLPWTLAGYLVPRLSGEKSGSLVLNIRGRGWSKVEPAYRTLLPWVVVAVLVWFFPAVSDYASLRTAATSWLTAGSYFFLSGLLSLPFFLGVVGPTVGSRLCRLLGLEAQRTDKVRSRAAARLVQALVGVGAVFLWLYLPRPAVSQGLVGTTSYYVFFLGGFYLVAGYIQGASRNILWPTLAFTVGLATVSILPSLLALFFRW